MLVLQEVILRVIRPRFRMFEQTAHPMWPDNMGHFPLQDGTGRLLVSWSPCRLIGLDEVDLPAKTLTSFFCNEENVTDPSLVRADPCLWIMDL